MAGAERTESKDMFDDICDVPGILVGHDTNLEAATGCTVVLCAAPARGSVDVRGGAPATRETDLLEPSRMMQEVHAILLTGGSAFGLDAASGVMRVLEARGVGYEAGVARVPIVPAAALFDLGLGRFDIRPEAAAGARATEAARGSPVAQGTVGVGTGATVGKLGGPTLAMKGGLGSASARLATGQTVGVLVAVNALGDIYDETTGRIVAGARRPQGAGWLNQQANSEWSERPIPGANTTLAVVATDLPLGKAALARLAQMAQDGLARAIRPVHTPFDGDVVFALSLAAPDASPSAESDSPRALLAAGMLAAEILARAAVKAVRAATSLYGVPAVRDLGVLGSRPSRGS
ncbi:MAG TPA: P1 family peptidase [Ktedonobacterales bacterium]